MTRNGIAAAFGIAYEYVRADLEFGTHKFKDVGVRYKGNGTFLSSREGLKRSLKLDLNQFVKGQKLAGMSQSAIRWTKHTLNHWYRQAGPIFDASLAYEFYGFGGPDAREGLMSHREKRAPEFSGPTSE